MGLFGGEYTAEKREGGNLYQDTSCGSWRHLGPLVLGLKFQNCTHVVFSIPKSVPFFFLSEASSFFFVGWQSLQKQ